MDASALQTGPPKGPGAGAVQALLARPANERRLGPFLLVEQLGRGGFAPVWLAREVYGGTELRTAAVKLFPLGAAGEGRGSTQAARGRILEEARALCRVEHPNVVRFYALPIDEARGVAGLAMEHVAGTALDRRLAVQGRLGAQETLAVGIAIASALAAVHRKGIVHRDVKPANVVEAAGTYKLIDFGIAAAEALGVRRAPGDAGRLEIDDLPPAAFGTRASTVIEDRLARPGDPAATTEYGVIACGTLGYVDPACIASGAPANEASDLYGLGVMLFECLAGHVPAAGPRGAGLSGKVLDGRAAAPPLLEVAHDAPPALARLVDALLRPDRRDRPASAEWVVIVLEQIRAELAGLSRALPPESVGPFRGLGRFHASDRGVYFGRSGEIAASVELLRGRGLLALVGPSGSGKSSLARAGVLPAVTEGALGGWPRQWDTVTTEPGHDPRAAVTAALASIVPGAGAREPDELLSALAERARSAQRGVVLLVDQLEELATLAEGPSRDWVVTLLHRLAAQPLPGVRAVVTARRDLLDPLLAWGGLGKALIQGSVLIEPLSAPTWAAVLDQALAAYGYSLEDDALRQDIAAEITETGSAMPLLQFALTELWEKRDTASKKITRAGLEAIGGLSGALERHAEATLAELGQEIPDPERAAKGVLVRLTTPRGTRSVCSQEDLMDAAGPKTPEVIDAFERARLIVPYEEGLTLAHEALLSQWRRLRVWVEEARDDRVLAEELERDAARWRVGPALAPLWQSHRLAYGEALSRKGHVRLSEDAAAFLNAGRWAARKSRIPTIAAAGALILGLVAAREAYVRSGWAEEAELDKQRALEDKEKALLDLENALERSKKSQAEAEQLSHDVAEQQKEIARLLETRPESPSTTKAQELSRQIVDSVSRARAKKQEGVGAVPAPASAAASAPPAESATATAPSSPPRPGIKPDPTW